MRAIQIKELVREIADLRVTTLPDLQPAPDKYLIQIHAAATNFFDVLQVKGKHQSKPPLPWIAGSEFSGEVQAVPTAKGDTKFKVGDQVFGATLGTFATQVLVDEVALRPKPAGWTYEQASGLFYTMPTAYAALVLRAKARAGEYVLIHGAGGALGCAAIQVSKALGLHVIATANSPSKRRTCTLFGADIVLDSEKNWEEEARSVTPNKRGVDVVLDPLGLVQRSLRCIRWDGRLVVIGFAAGEIEKISMNKLLLNNVSVSGLFWGMYSEMDPEAVVKVWDHLLDLIDQGKVRPMNYNAKQFIGLDSVPDALSLLASGQAWGKIVVNVQQATQATSSKL